jgi:hypothetical protein
MTIALVAALAAALALAALTSATLLWQLKRAAKAADKWSSGVETVAEQKILLAAAQVAVADKERAMNMTIADNDRLEFTVETLKEQRDSLLKEAFENATPGSIAISVRDALQRLRLGDKEEAPDSEAVPDLPSS